MERQRSILVFCALGIAIVLVASPTGAHQRLDAQQVYVVGHVVKPIAVPFNASMTLTQATSAAGGPLKDKKYDKVMIIRSLGDTKIQTCVSLKRIQKQRMSDVQLQPYDVIDVESGECSRLMCWEILTKPDTKPIRIINDFK